MARNGKAKASDREQIEGRAKRTGGVPKQSRREHRERHYEKPEHYFSPPGGHETRSVNSGSQQG